MSVDLRIQMDKYPEEIGWRMERIGVKLEVIESRVPGVYKQENILVEEKIILEEGELYSFVVFDIYKDGICCGFGSGEYDLKFGNQLIFAGDGEFKDGRDHTFIATTDAAGSTQPPEESGPGDSFLELQIQFDEFPEEVGWILRLNEAATTRQSEVVAFKPSRSYANTLKGQLVTETIPLQEGGVYTFHILDSFSDGMCCQYGDGYYRLFDGPIDNGILLASGNAEGQSRESTTFTIVAGPPAPTTAPELTISPAPTAPLVEVEIYIQPDKFPRDIGWRIFDENGFTVASVPAGTYTTEAVIQETVSLQSDSVYTFVITDDFENGICCQNGNGFFRIDTDNGLVGYGGDYKNRDEVIFTTPGAFTVDMKLSLDQYPAEVAWRLERLDLKENALVSQVSISTYDTPLEVVRRQFLVTEGGFYRLVVQDRESDGICCEVGEGSIALSVGDDNRVVASEPGDYFSLTAFNFLGTASGVLPKVTDPRTLTLSITFDRFPEETSWVLMQSDIESSISRTFRRKDFEIAAFGPKEGPYYSANLQGTTITETIEIEQIPEGVTRDYTLIMLDSARDGLCCDYGVGTYTLYDGAKANTTNILVVGRTDSDGGERDAQTFSLDAEGIASSPSPTPNTSGASSWSTVLAFTTLSLAVSVSLL